MIFNNLELLKAEKRNFIITKDSQISYEKAIDRVNRISYLLTENGIKVGDKVLLSINNDYDTACIFLSLLNLGVTTILLDPQYKVQKAKSILDKLSLDGWIVDKNLEEDWGLKKGAKLSCPFSFTVDTQAIGRGSKAPIISL